MQHKTWSPLANSGDVGSACRRFWKHRSGSNAVEFALLAPLLFFLLLASVWLAIYLGTAHSLAQIAADVSRYAMVGHDEAERKTLALRWMEKTGQGYPLVDARRMTMLTSEADAMLKVSVAYDMSFMPVPTFVAEAANLSPVIVRTATVLIP